MRKLPFKVNTKQALVIGAFVIFGFMLMDLNSRLMELSRVSVQRDAIQTEVVGLRSTEQELKDQIDYAESDQAVERWAREEGHMARPGDQVIIPIPPKGATPLPPPLPTPVVRKVENWEVWWALFWGE